MACSHAPCTTLTGYYNQQPIYGCWPAPRPTGLRGKAASGRGQGELSTLRLLTFRAGGRRLALPLDEVRAVLPLPLLAHPAGAPGFVEGFFDFRGAPAAAVRLDRLLELPDETLGVYSPLILLASPDPAIALHVAGADGVSRVDAAAVQPIGDDDTFNGCVNARISEGGETIYLLRSANILLAAERATIAAHEAMRGRRLAALDGGERAA